MVLRTDKTVCLKSLNLTTISCAVRGRRNKRRSRITAERYWFQEIVLGGFRRRILELSLCYTESFSSSVVYSVNQVKYTFDASVTYHIQGSLSSLFCV